MIRRTLNVIHRWTGLLMAGFLVIVGLTGSLLAFNSELEHLVTAPAPRHPETWGGCPRSRPHSPNALGRRFRKAG